MLSNTSKGEEKLIIGTTNEESILSRNKILKKMQKKLKKDNININIIF